MFAKFKRSELDLREIDHTQRKLEFRDKIAEEVKASIMENANRSLQLLKIKEQNKIAQERRIERDRKIALEQRAKAVEEGRNPDENPDDENTGWGRGSAIEDARKAQRENAERDNRRNTDREGGATQSVGFSRGDFVRRTGASPPKESPRQGQQE